MYLLRKTLEEYNLSHILECKYGNYRIINSSFLCDVTKFEEIAEKYLHKTMEESDWNEVVLIYKGGYLEESGYLWAYERAAALELLFYDLQYEKNITQQVR